MHHLVDMTTKDNPWIEVLQNLNSKQIKHLGR